MKTTTGQTWYEKFTTFFRRSGFDWKQRPRFLFSTLYVYYMFLTSNLLKKLFAMAQCGFWHLPLSSCQHLPCFWLWWLAVASPAIPSILGRLTHSCIRNFNSLCCAVDLKNTNAGFCSWYWEGVWNRSWIWGIPSSTLRLSGWALVFFFGWQIQRLGHCQVVLDLDLVSFGSARPCYLPNTEHIFS